MKKRGIGIGCMHYGIGYGFSRQDIASAVLEVCYDGSVICRSGEVDYGQGSDTVVCQIISEELGIPCEDIQLITADTFATPNSGPTSASRVTYVIGNVLIDVTKQIKDEMSKVAAELLGEHEYIFKDQKVCSKKNPEICISFKDLSSECHNRGRPMLKSAWYNNTTKDVDPETGQGDAYALYSYASQIAVVDVETDTGEVEIVRMIAAHDVGKAINPINIEGQVEGGISMGIGYALSEELRKENGRILTKSFGDYLIPTSLDMPPVDVHIVEVPAPNGPYGAKGVGEPPLIPTAPAILNAIADAIDVRVADLPANLENLYKLIQAKEEQQAE
jgi:CO/xanthine dehydrogenase Mo-binding subunit